ncbi:MAG: hypothetical protein IKF99_11935 [Oscillospiraceae bacterium]|nr:hypothetical protein [Oscillospiraceae bacterium]
MSLNLTQRFKTKPTMYYAMSIVASWAGVGSLMNFRTLALNNGVIPAVIWAVFNTLACIIFGLMAEHLPYVRKIMQTKAMSWFIGFLTVFQTWTQMSGITEIFDGTMLGRDYGMYLAYLIAVIFIVLLYEHGMIRNVLTDSGSWVIVYGLLLLTVVGSLIHTGGAYVHVSAGTENISTGITKGLLLLPGPFTYPYYYTLFKYNEDNEDGTANTSIKRSFILAGLMFGAYMVFAAVLTFVEFSPWLNVLKAFLITVIAASSLTTYIYSEYLVFGQKAGAVINVATVAGWYWLMPLGVMGIWTLMSEIRWVIILAVVLVAVAMKIRDHARKGVSE